MSTIAEARLEQGFETGPKLGVKQGIKQGVLQGRREGYLAAIEFGLELRLGAVSLALLPEMRKVNDLETLRTVQLALKTAAVPDQVRAVYQQSAL